MDGSGMAKSKRVVGVRCERIDRGGMRGEEGKRMVGCLRL